MRLERGKTIFLLIIALFFELFFPVVSFSQEVPIGTQYQYKVVIDPGHPSENGEGCTSHGLKECEINWKVSILTKQILDQDQKIQVILTKGTEKEYLTNKDRAVIANKNGAHLFLRLHCDYGNGSNSGYTIYYPDAKGKKGDFSGPSDEVIKMSRIGANRVHSGMKKILEGLLKDNGIKTDRETLIGKRQGALTGSIYCETPVVTIEMVFLSNTHDANFLKTDDGIKKMASAIAEGVKNFLISSSKGN
ncbi:MAG: N-acetylmuramoyl-L-alanine amidase [Candidatus Riflebacteria bacterium]|nr:N-acetylmuramoyl-L-alanine amidase [Candidatus Riflebacteria bacterium]